MQTAYINNIDYALANNPIHNSQLAVEYPDYSSDVIMKNSGVATRYAVDHGTICSDFAAEKSNAIIKKLGIDKCTIDFLIYCTEAPDYIAPASSVILHRKLGLNNDCGTFDVQFGCSGYTYGLLLAKSLIESGVASKVLFVTADLPTQGISKVDPSLRFLFSDAVSVSFITSESKGYKIGEFIKGTDGSGEQALRVEGSGFNKPRKIDWYTNTETKDLPVGRMTMDGTAVFRFSLKVVPQVIEDTLVKNQLKMENIDLFIFHQASQIILKSLQRKLKIDDNRIFNNIEKVGNTVSASIPIALSQALECGKIKKNMNIMIVGFGIGFSWSATVLNTANL